MGIRVGGSSVSREPHFHVVRDNAVADIHSPVSIAYGIHANNAEGSLFVGNAIPGARTPNPACVDATSADVSFDNNVRDAGYLHWIATRRSATTAPRR